MLTIEHQMLNVEYMDGRAGRRKILKQSAGLTLAVVSQLMVCMESLHPSSNRHVAGRYGMNELAQDCF